MSATDQGRSQLHHDVLARRATLTGAQQPITHRAARLHVRTLALHCIICASLSAASRLAVGESSGAGSGGLTGFQPQQRLNFLPDPHLQGSFRPCFTISKDTSMVTGLSMFNPLIPGRSR